MNELDKLPTAAPLHGIVLLPCPFCGGEAHILEHTHMMREFTVYCGACNTQHGVWQDTDEAAFAAWNCRIGDPCHDGCKIKRAVNEMSDSLTVDY